MAAPYTGIAVLYRFAGSGRPCPNGERALEILRRRGFKVEDRRLRSLEEEAAFRLRHEVDATPLIYVDGERIGGYAELVARFGDLPQRAFPRHLPVTAVFVVTALLALAANHATSDALAVRGLEWFVGGGLCIIAVLRLQDMRRCAEVMRSFDLLARRWPAYGYAYPVLDAAVGLLVIGELVPYVAAPVALAMGLLGAASGVNAAFIKRRKLTCSCIGGAKEEVSLAGFFLLENLMLLTAGAWSLTGG